MTPPSDTQRTSVQGSAHLLLTGAGSSWGGGGSGLFYPSSLLGHAKEELPDAQSCSQRPGRFRRRSARRRPGWCRACGPAAAARSRTGPGGCARRRRRCPGCRDGRAPRGWESYAISTRPREKSCGMERGEDLVSLSRRSSACSGTPYTWLKPWRRRSAPTPLGPAGDRRLEDPEGFLEKAATDR